MSDKKRGHDYVPDDYAALGEHMQATIKLWPASRDADLAAFAREMAAIFRAHGWTPPDLEDSDER